MDAISRSVAGVVDDEDMATILGFFGVLDLDFRATAGRSVVVADFRGWKKRGAHEWEVRRWWWVVVVSERIYYKS